MYIDCNGNNPNPTGTIFNSNGGNNFKANFTVNNDPASGIYESYAVIDQGSGNNQTTTPSAETATNNTESPAPGEVAAKPVESSVPVSEPKTQAAKPKSSPAKTTYEAQSKTPSAIKGSEKSSTASKDPSPAKKEPTPVTQPSTSEAEKTTTKAAEKPKIDQRAIFGAGARLGHQFSERAYTRGHTSFSSETPSASVSV